jgi:hypothetical protein
MTLKMESLVVLVIARNKSAMDQQSIKWLRKSIELEIINASTPNSLRKSAYRPARRVKPIEMAISVSHHRARLRAEVIGKQWTLILEEDAIINFKVLQLFELIENLAKNHDRKMPLGIHLFPEQFGILTKNLKSDFLNVKYLPDYAVGYCLNLSAIKRAIKDFDANKVELADWPHKIRKNISWFAPSSSFVLHPDTHLFTTKSSTSKYREERKNHSFFYLLSSFRIIPLLLIKTGHILNLKFGENPIASEKIRSIKLSI